MMAGWRSLTADLLTASHCAFRDRHGGERTSSAQNTRQGKRPMKLTIFAATGGIG
jgi:hypothetical protein